MGVVLTYTLLLLPVMVHMAFDIHKRYTGHPIRHWASALIAVFVSVLMGFLDALVNGVAAWQFAFYALSVHFAFFDLFWNWYHGHVWHYNGDPKNPDRAWTDKMWDYVPVYAQPFVRAWVLAVGWSFYYRLDWIIG
jgi:hypothetical protein